MVTKPRRGKWTMARASQCVDRVRSFLANTSARLGFLMVQFINLLSIFDFRPFICLEFLEVSVYLKVVMDILSEAVGRQQHQCCQEKGDLLHRLRLNWPWISHATVARGSA